MPNTASAKKRLRQNDKRRMHNRAGKSNMRTQIRKVKEAVAAGNKDLAQSEYIVAQKKIDLFNDLEGDIKNTFEGENRVSNIVIYRTPNLSNFTSMVAFVPGEGSDLTGDGSADSSINDGISLNLCISHISKR